MRNSKGIRTIFSILLCLCYLCSVVGFDIHTDHHDNHSYVVSLLSNLSCECIHPEDECECTDEDHCCNHNDCEDEADFLTITGTDNGFSFDFTAPLVGDVFLCTPAVVSLHNCLFAFAAASSSPPREMLRSLCVLRV